MIFTVFSRKVHFFMIFTVFSRKVHFSGKPALNTVEKCQKCQRKTSGGHSGVISGVISGVVFDHFGSFDSVIVSKRSLANPCRPLRHAGVPGCTASEDMVALVVYPGMGYGGSGAYPGTPPWYGSGQSCPHCFPTVAPTGTSLASLGPFWTLFWTILASFGPSFGSVLA